MNKTKGIILCSLVTTLFGALLTMGFITEETYSSPNSAYQVYLDGNKIGLINSKEKLYELINNEQTEIKEEYDVDQVYPPKGFKIIKKNTYDTNLTTIEDVYYSIKDEKTFTIKGYTITIKSDIDGAIPTYIYVLDEKIFREALENVVKTFIGSDRYTQYLTNTQSEIKDTGYIIEQMYFKDNISIKESFISVDQKIYTNTQELTKFLLFGTNEASIEYTVVQGDTIEKIAANHKLNVEELLIANDDINSEDTLLAIGQKVNVALINPILSLVYEELITEDVDQQFQEEEEKDATQYIGYVKVKQEGVNGINRITSRIQFTNGERNQGGFIVESQVIRPVQNKITVKGSKRYTTSQPPNTVYIDNNAPWAWPTNSPYVITSEYGYRWGTLHDGMDISGTGYGSPIYASLDGEVVQAKWGGIVGNTCGLNVVLKHDNGYYTIYCHCSKLNVKAGDRVSRKQRIASMGATGNVTGTHLHFGVFYGGPPYNGGRSLNPRKIWS